MQHARRPEERFINGSTASERVGYYHYAFRLGGEQTAMAHAEVLALLAAEGHAGSECHMARSPEGEARLLRLALARPLAPHAIARLALTRTVAEQVLTVDDCDALAEAAGSLRLAAESFAVRCRRLGDHYGACDLVALERRLGARLAGEARVDLEHPEVTVQLLAGARFHVGVVRHATAFRSCSARHLNLRPRFSPISLPPRLARAMVNLAAPPSGERVLDPFCGTGGILLETAEMGLPAVGRDLLPGMVAASRENLAHFGLSAELAEGDVGAVAGLSNIGAIVTDPPYGRSTTTRGEPLAALMARAAGAFRAALAPGRRLVLALAEPELFPGDGFRLLHSFEWYVHRSLTRHVLVYERE